MTTTESRDTIARNTAAEWLADVGRAAADLGYYVEAIDAHHVRLIGPGRVEIDIDTVTMSGDTLRRLLRPVVT